MSNVILSDKTKQEISGSIEALFEQVISGKKSVFLSAFLVISALSSGLITYIWRGFLSSSSVTTFFSWQENTMNLVAVFIILGDLVYSVSLILSHVLIIQRKQGQKTSIRKILLIAGYCNIIITGINIVIAVIANFCLYKDHAHDYARMISLLPETACVFLFVMILVKNILCVRFIILLSKTEKNDSRILRITGFYWIFSVLIGIFLVFFMILVFGGYPVILMLFLPCVIRYFYAAFLAKQFTKTIKTEDSINQQADMIKSDLNNSVGSETLYGKTDCRSCTNNSELILSVFSPGRIRFLVVLFLLSVCSCVLSDFLMFSETRDETSDFSSFHFIDVFGSISPLTPFFIVSLLMAIVNIINVICTSMSYKSFTRQKEGKLVSAIRPLRIASVVGIGAEVVSMFTFFGFFGIIYGNDYVPYPFFKDLPPIIFSCIPLLMMIGQHICIVKIFTKCEKNNSLPGKKSVMSFLVFSLLYCFCVILFPFGFIDLFMIQFDMMLFGIVIFLLLIYALPAVYAVKLAVQYIKTISSPVMNM